MKTQAQIYNELFKRWVELNELKPGDKVKIVSKFEEDDPRHFDLAFKADSMSRLVGVIGEVKYVETDNFTICVYTPSKNNYWYWPYYCLEKVEEKEKSVDVEIIGSNITFEHDAFDISITKEGTTIKDYDFTLDELKYLCKQFRALPEQCNYLALGSDVLLADCDIEDIENAIAELE